MLRASKSIFSWEEELLPQEPPPQAGEEDLLKVIARNVDNLIMAIRIQHHILVCPRGLDHDHVTRLVMCEHVIEDSKGKAIDYGNVYDERIDCANHHDAMDAYQLREYVEDNLTAQEEELSPQEVQALMRLMENI